ncbi:glycosyltransferase family 1 protein [Candidatus Collinsella stercoripullorum]|uniref:glycosyltransferase family 1 protein n=1 Tax=Candidatus Collinsella stercoripullorum TaxID=2838522 RepID=UPI0022E4D694|nr:glycosyltransferase family 1 protein [Candidatus Collinsella stercoripullorum]
MKSPPIRVLHLLQRMEPAGVQSFLMNLYRDIDRSKVQFDFLVHYKEHQFYDDEIEQMGGRIYKLSVREDYNLVAYARELRTFFSQHREYSVLHGHMETLSGIWMVEAERAGIPTRIAHSHTAGFGKGPKAIVRELFRYQYPRHATDLFACSKAAGDFMFPGKGYRLIPNAIEVEKFSFRKDVRKDVRLELGIDRDAFVVGSVGRFHASKNYSFLIEVMKKLSSLKDNCVLLLVGDGSERSHLEDKVHELGLEKVVRFLGKRQDVHRLYQSFDAFVLPSRYEGLPLVGIEAQASGCPSFFSTGVSAETGITDLATFLPLDGGLDAWARAIADADAPFSREKYASVVANAGYDVHGLADDMARFYLERSTPAGTVSPEGVMA